MKITKRQLRRIIREEKAVLEQSWRQNPAKIRQARRERDRQSMIDTMTFNQLKRKAFDSAQGIQGRLDTGQYEYEDIWEVEIPRLADYIDAAKVKAAEEGTTYDDVPEVRHRGGLLDFSQYSLGLPPGIKENKMKITKRQLRQIIKEEKAKLSEISAEQAAKINAEQQGLQSQASLSQLLIDLNETVDQMVTVLGAEETAQELEGIADELYRGSR